MSSIEIGISFYVLPVVLNLMPISLCYNFNGSFFDLYEVTEGYFDSPEVVPRCFGIWRALGAYPWVIIIWSQKQSISLIIIWSPKQPPSTLWQYNLITNTINVVKIGTCRGNCRGTFWHRPIRRASTIYRAERIITPLMIKTTMMMVKFKLMMKFALMIDIKVVDWKISP